CDRATIARALAKIPESRFPSCQQMVASLVAAGSVQAAEQKPASTGIRRKGSSCIIPRKVVLPATAPEQNDAKTPTDAHSAPTVICDSSTPLPETLQQPAQGGSSLPLTKPATDTGLRPTLIVGIGGIACWTLRKLRHKLQRRFGDAGAVPALRMLLLDTDRAALQQARQGEPGEALEAGDTLLIPLQRPEHYRERAPEILKWLDRRWLYNIPRSQLTEGIRPLGRLALVDNAAEVLGRLKETLTALTSGEAKA